MPAPGKRPSKEQRFRRVLLDLLRRIGVLRSDVDPSDERLICLAEMCQLGNSDFVVCEELDRDIPF